MAKKPPKDPADYKRPNETGDDFEVGRGRPPKETQFKPGQKSANPAGRPRRGEAKFSTERKERVIPIQEGGKIVQASMSEVARRQLENKAAQGDHKSIIALLRIVADEKKLASERGPSAAEIIKSAEEEREKQALSGKISRGVIEVLDVLQTLQKSGLAAEGANGTLTPTMWATIVSEIAPGGRSYPMGAPPEVEAVRKALDAYFETLNMTHDDVRAARKRPAATPPA